MLCLYLPDSQSLTIYDKSICLLILHCVTGFINKNINHQKHIPYTAKLSRGKTFAVVHKTHHSLENFRGASGPCHYVLCTASDSRGKLSRLANKPQKFSPSKVLPYTVILSTKTYFVGNWIHWDRVQVSLGSPCRIDHQFRMTKITYMYNNNIIPTSFNN